MSAATAAAIENLKTFLSPRQSWSVAQCFSPITYTDEDGTEVTGKPRVSLWTGAIRSGKTIASLLAWLMYVAIAPRGGALVVVGRTRESIARNVFAPLQDPSLFGPLARFVSYTAGAPTATILGRTIYVLGASDARAEAVLRGLTCAGAYVDEATLVSEAFWTQLLGRMSVPGAQLFATTNPDGPAHWLKRSVLDRAHELGYRVFQFRLTDNTHLDPAYVRQISREYVGLWRRRFIDGEWVQAAGAVYSMWDEARHVIAPADIPDMNRVLALGIDYGDIHPTRGYLVGIGPDTRPGYSGYRLYVLDEWRPKAGSMTMGQYSRAARTWLVSRPVAAWQHPEWTPVDSAASGFIRQLKADGLRGVRRARKDVLPGIQAIGSLLAIDKLVVSDACVDLKKKITAYVWDDKATARGETAPIKSDDDEVDALRYAIYTSRHTWSRLIDISLTDTSDDDTDDEDDD